MRSKKIIKEGNAILANLMALKVIHVLELIVPNFYELK